MPKQAEIIAIGSELLTPERVDTNSLIVTRHLNLLGVEVAGKQVVGDDRPRLIQAIRAALDRCDILILIGGLGPTEDDVTRDAAPKAAKNGNDLERMAASDALTARLGVRSGGVGHSGSLARRRQARGIADEDIPRVRHSADKCGKDGEPAEAGVEYADGWD